MQLLRDNIRIYPRKKVTDQRGWFLKTLTGNEEFLQPKVGEIYFTCGLAGQKKGGHYHPIAKEWFTLIQGKAILKLEDMLSHEKLSIRMDADTPQTIYIPEGVAHAVECAEGCEQFVLCAYTDQQYDSSDTIPYELS